MTNGEQYFAVTGLASCPAGLCGGWWGKAAHGLYELLHIAVVQGIAVCRFDSLNLVVRARCPGYIPILDGDLVGCPQNIKRT